MKPYYSLPLTLIIILLSATVLAQPSDRLHEPWDRLLKSYTSRGVVDYAPLKDSPADMIKLDAYLTSLGKADIQKLTVNAQLAFWINAYNAFTVKLILNHYPLKSIRDISSPWKQKIWMAGGQLHSLDDIEHKILREQLKDPRIHFAIVCASKGCPDLSGRAYLSTDIQLSLDKAARHFFSQMKNFRIHKSGPEATIYLSKIFKWFRKDFGGEDSELIAFMKPYLSMADVIRLNNTAKYDIKYIDYDWSLNGKAYW